VLDAFRGIAACVPDLLTPGGKQAAVGVEQVRDLYVFEGEILIDVGIPLAVDAGDADADDLVGAADAAGGLGAGNGDEGKNGTGRGCLFQEAAACELVHDSLRVQGGKSICRAYLALAGSASTLPICFEKCC